jgi:cupin fold WbuC family metalloprotein
MTGAETTGLTPSNLRSVAPGIFYTDRSFVLIDPAIIGFLKEQAAANSLGRARVCAHPSADADQHDMLIVSHRDTYVAPHRHHSKSESFLIIEGRATLLLFSADGIDIRMLPMGSADTGRPFFYRMPAEQYHSLSIETEFLVFAESTKGPFRPQDMENAPWAPGPKDTVGGRSYITALKYGPPMKNNRPVKPRRRVSER